MVLCELISSDKLFLQYFLLASHVTEKRVSDTFTAKTKQNVKLGSDEAHDSQMKHSYFISR